MRLAGDQDCEQHLIRLTRLRVVKESLEEKLFPFDSLLWFLENENLFLSILILRYNSSLLARVFEIGLVMRLEFLIGVELISDRGRAVLSLEGRLPVSLICFYRLKNNSLADSVFNKLKISFIFKWIFIIFLKHLNTPKYVYRISSPLGKCFKFS